MSGEETSGSSKANNVLRLSMLEHLSGLLEMFASRADAECGDQDENEDECQGADDDGSESETGDEHEHEQALLPKWTASNLDVGTWMAWELVGLQLLSGDKLPDLRMFTTAARRVLLIAAIERFDGNITRMAEALGTSRRALREQLKAAGLYAEGTSDEAPAERGPQAEEPGSEGDDQRVTSLW